MTGVMVPARGVRRRLQALHARGWTATELEQQLGIPDETLGMLLWQSTVPQRTHDIIAAAYEVLWNQAPPSPPAVRQQAIARATANGWAPPMAWDDIDTDDAPFTGTEDPDAAAAYIDHVAIELTLRGEPAPALTQAERRIAVARLHAGGHCDMEMARRLHVDGNTIRKDRKAQGLPLNLTRWSTVRAEDAA
ncbi:hypothetical protein [Microbacterium dauci]|uniref:Uncharacterized protein n=1 Tax=Microbacterium dauci TaxID=3048008 RepID=A0ABT6ZAM1_9MICO|nr:hypothetical protein [Microbacterium sp. LX3-4]MDJ1113212.1 hypothetical protein [Microbacterium sp. LX3-4]